METHEKFEHEKPENPPAFPEYTLHKIGDIAVGTTNPGMMLRDYFAAKAMPAIINETTARPEVKWEDAMDATAKLSYLIADAMLKARQS